MSQSPKFFLIPGLKQNFSSINFTSATALGVTLIWAGEFPVSYVIISYMQQFYVFLIQTFDRYSGDIRI